MKQCIMCEEVLFGSEVKCSKCGGGLFSPVKSTEPANSLSESNAKTPSVFISHAWDHSEGYKFIVRLLNADRNFRWENISIPIERAIQVAGEPQARSKQLRQKITDRILILDSEIMTIEQQLKVLNAEKEKLQEHVDWLVSQVDPKEYDALLPNEKPAPQTELLNLNISLSDARDRLSNLWRKKQQLERKFNLKDIERAGLVRGLEGDEEAIDIFKPTANRQSIGAIKRRQALHEAPILALAIYEKIVCADCMLVVATQGSAFRHWMEYEIEIGMYASKPIFAIAYPAQESIPQDYKSYGLIEIPLQSKAISGAIMDAIEPP